MTIKSLSPSQIALIMKKGRAYNSGSFLLKTHYETVVFDDKKHKNTGKTTPEHKKQEKTDKNKGLELFCTFIASKKVFIKAVDRNRVKRRMKESFLKELTNVEKNGGILKTPTPQFVFLAKKETIRNDFKIIGQEIEQILLKDYIIK